VTALTTTPLPRCLRIGGACHREKGGYHRDHFEARRPTKPTIHSDLDTRPHTALASETPPSFILAAAPALLLLSASRCRAAARRDPTWPHAPPRAGGGAGSGRPRGWHRRRRRATPAGPQRGAERHGRGPWAGAARYPRVGDRGGERRPGTMVDLGQHVRPPSGAAAWRGTLASLRAKAVAAGSPSGAGTPVDILTDPPPGREARKPCIRPQLRPPFPHSPYTPEATPSLTGHPSICAHDVPNGGWAPVAGMPGMSGPGHRC